MGDVIPLPKPEQDPDAKKWEWLLLCACRVLTAHGLYEHVARLHDLESAVISIKGNFTKWPA